MSTFATPTIRVSWLMPLLNTLGALVYLWLVAKSWAIPEERAAGIYAVTGEPFVWIMGVPTFLLFCLADCVWFFVTVRKRQAARAATVGLVCSALTWAAAISFDFAHH